MIAPLLDFLFPPACPACKSRTDGALFCPACQPLLEPFLPPLCACCGIPTSRWNVVDTCLGCRLAPPAFRTLRAAFQYGGPLREAILGLKHSDRQELAPRLARLAAGQLRPTLERTPDLVMPVPLHPRRIRQRGYNQAALLARGFARLLGADLDLRALRRVRDTPSQQGLTAAQRAANVAAAFAVLDRHRTAGFHVLLVDDVCASGATARECSRTLLEAGAASVQVWVLARPVED